MEVQVRTTLCSWFVAFRVERMLVDPNRASLLIWLCVRTHRHWNEFFPDQQILWGPWLFSGICFILLSKSGWLSQMFTLKWWFIVEQRGELLGLESATGYSSTGGMLWGVTCSLDMSSRKILTLLLWSCKVAWIWSCKGGISLACCYTRFTLEKLHHLLFDFSHLSLELASKETVRKKCICEVSTCKTWQVSEVWHCIQGMSESERRLCC